MSRTPLKCDIDIAQRLKDLRTEYGYTQKQVANGTGITVATIGAYEEGRAFPPVPFLILISRFYGIRSIDELLGNTDQKEKQEAVLEAYYRSDPEKRKIVDFILNLNC